MRRVHLFEIEDQPWCPDVVRDAGTAYLAFAMARTGMLDPVWPLLERALRVTGASRVVDLCSGSAWPASYVARRAAEAGLDVEVVATDLFPHEAAMARAASTSDGRLRAWSEPVDATAVPEALSGVRTLFNAFHHFRPAQARAILEDAVSAGQPIAVVELVDRRPANLLGMPFIPFVVAAVVPLLRPFRWAWLPLTYLLPVIPAFVLWDGIVSCLRIYQPDELRELVEGLDAFDWSIERVPLPAGPIFATCLVGTPREGAA